MICVPIASRAIHDGLVEGPTRGTRNHDIATSGPRSGNGTVLGTRGSTVTSSHSSLYWYLDYYHRHHTKRTCKQWNRGQNRQSGCPGGWKRWNAGPSGLAHVGKHNPWPSRPLRKIDPVRLGPGRAIIGDNIPAGFPRSP